MGPRRLAVLLSALVLLPGAAWGQEKLRVGSKRFTESYILGELLAKVAGGEHKPGLGNTAILLEALKAGSIDVYPEYMGTIAREILKTEDRLDLAGINARLKPLGLEAGVPLGFSNSYGLGMPRAKAVKSISDLGNRTDVRAGFSHEFLGRKDGWLGLRDAYGLKLAPRGLDHGLAYEALKTGELDLIDVYTTDAKIERYDIVVLADDKGFFPSYEAVLLYRIDAAQRVAPLRKLEKSIDAPTMVRLNARAEIDKVPFQQVAAEHLGAARAGSRTLWSAIAAPDFGRLLIEHLGLVFGSLVVAVIVGVPLGIVAARWGWLEQPVLIATGLIQTIPSLALLAFLIPLTGMIGVWPALIALFLYALLPITRNTHTGLVQIPKGLKQAGTALGLTAPQIRRHVEIPLALPTIMAGIKTSAVINVGMATIAAFIGAGGFGERISQGLALNDHAVLLAGALPAAGLALVVHGVFEAIERSLLSHR